MNRLSIIAFAALAGAAGLTVATHAQAQVSAETATPTADPGLIQSPPLPRMALTPARDVPPAPPPDTTQPGVLPAAPSTGAARVSPAVPVVLPPTANEPAGTATPSRVNLTPTTPDAIAGAQIVLQNMGLYKGPINGILTGPTRAALRVYQSQAALPVTGHLDTRTFDSLAPVLTSPTATQAVEQLQIDAGLPVTGQVDEATRQVLETGFIPQEGGLPVVRFRDTLPLAAGSP